MFTKLIGQSSSRIARAAFIPTFKAKWPFRSSAAASRITALPFDPKRCFRWAEEHRLRRVQKVAASERSTVSPSVIAAITAKGVEPLGNQRARARRISDSHQNAGNWYADDLIVRFNFSASQCERWCQRRNYFTSLFQIEFLCFIERKGIFSWSPHGLWTDREIYLEIFFSRTRLLRFINWFCLAYALFYYYCPRISTATRHYKYHSHILLSKYMYPIYVSYFLISFAGGCKFSGLFAFPLAT